MPQKKVVKCELIDAVSEKTKCERQTVQLIFDAILEELKTNLEKTFSIELRGFGTFEARLRKGRKVARNPKTGETLAVAPHYVAAFRAGKDLKKQLLAVKIGDGHNDAKRDE